jgi:hypothetical protein
MTADKLRKKVLLAAHEGALRASAAGYLLKHGDVFVEPFDGWVRADVERIAGLSATEREWLISAGVLMLWKAFQARRQETMKSTYAAIGTQYPRAIRADARIDFDVGWAVILEYAAHRIQSFYPAEWRAMITGGKEKFGCLVLHIDYDRSHRGSRSEVERLREEVRLMSLGTCELCSENGRLRLGGFAKTLCNRHVGVVGELRADDGLYADPWKWSDEGM